MNSPLKRRKSNRRNPFKITIQIPKIVKPFEITSTGTLTDGQLRINQRGIQMDGIPPDVDRRRHIFLQDLEEIEDLGEGASGNVKQVKHIPTDTILALKTVKFNHDTNAAIQNLRELHNCFRMSHEYIVSSHSAFFVDGDIKIVMEYCDSGTLSNALKVKAQFNEQIISIIALQILLGLNYLHIEMQMIHRDIKPSNLLLCSDSGICKIADFGVSTTRIVDGRAETFVGTTRYMAPERINGSGQYSFGSDIFALGLSLFELATGAYPYDTSGGTIFDIISQFDIPLKLDRKIYSENFCKFIESCLIVNPETRPSTTELLNYKAIKKVKKYSKNGSSKVLRKWIKKNKLTSLNKQEED